MISDSGVVTEPGILSWYHYSHGMDHPTTLADLHKPPVTMIADLLLRAHQAAPVVAQKAWESQCGTERPHSNGRRGLAWDLTAEALTWALLQKDMRLFMEAKQRIADGQAVRVSYDVLADQITLHRMVDGVL